MSDKELLQSINNGVVSLSAEVKDIKDRQKSMETEQRNFIRDIATNSTEIKGLKEDVREVKGEARDAGRRSGGLFGSTGGTIGGAIAGAVVKLFGG